MDYDAGDGPMSEEGVDDDEELGNLEACKCCSRGDEDKTNGEDGGMSEDRVTGDGFGLSLEEKVTNGEDLGTDRRVADGLKTVAGLSVTTIVSESYWTANCASNKSRSVVLTLS